MKLRILSIGCGLMTLACTPINYASEINNNAPHTWHTITSTLGSWQGNLTIVNQHGSFVQADGTLLHQFTVQENKPVKFGFVLAKKTDFDVAYTLTLTQREKPDTKRFTSKTCVYLITAKGPAEPDITITNFNGAHCEMKDDSGMSADFIAG